MKRAILFPGQGAQKVGMGADLYESNSTYREIFDAIDGALDFSLQSACFDFVDMDRSEYVQPAIFAHSIALYMALGTDADVYAGLSLGEYTALCATGMIDISRCAQLVNRRGHIMDSAIPAGEGGMMSILGLAMNEVIEVVDSIDGVYVANHLQETQIVIAGKSDTVLGLEQTFTDMGAKAIPLATSGPFHTQMLDTAAQEFTGLLTAVDFGEPNAIIYSNYTAKPYSSSNDAVELLAKQMSRKVRWHEIIEQMVADGVTEFVEIGPSMTLSKMLKRSLKGSEIEVYSVRDAKTLDKYLQRNGAK